MSNPFTVHPSSVGETYPQHGSFALRFGARMAIGGIAAMIHGVLPFLFVTTASRALEDLNQRLALARARQSSRAQLTPMTPSS